MKILNFKQYNESIDFRVRSDDREYVNINEDIDSGSFIVYHRTDRDPLDFNKGFKSSQYGGAYGTGLYTFYDLESANDEYNHRYGKHLIEISVQNNGKFLILDPKLLKKVYGTNISLIDQLEKLLGGKFNKFYQQNKERIEELKNLDLGVNSSQILGGFVFGCKGFIQVCDGALVIDDKLGNVFVLYETSLMNPIRYSDDDGKTWKSIKNKESYNIGKDNRSGENKISNQKFSGIEV